MMLFPLYLLLSTAVTLIATWTNDFAPFGVPGLTRRTLGIDFGIKDGHFSLRVYGDDASEDNLMHLEPVPHFGPEHLELPVLAPSGTTTRHFDPTMPAPCPTPIVGVTALVLAFSVVGVALVSTRASRAQINADDVNHISLAPSTLLIDLGILSTSESACTVLPPIQISSTDAFHAPTTTPASAFEPGTMPGHESNPDSSVHTSPADSTVARVHLPTPMSNHVHPSVSNPSIIAMFPAPSTPVRRVKARGQTRRLKKATKVACAHDICVSLEAPSSPLSRRSKRIRPLVYFSPLPTGKTLLEPFHAKHSHPKAQLYHALPTSSSMDITSAYAQSEYLGLDIGIHRVGGRDTGL